MYYNTSLLIYPCYCDSIFHGVMARRATTKVKHSYAVLWFLQYERARRKYIKVHDWKTTPRMCCAWITRRGSRVENRVTTEGASSSSRLLLPIINHSLYTFSTRDRALVKLFFPPRGYPQQKNVTTSAVAAQAFSRFSLTASTLGLW